MPSFLTKILLFMSSYLPLWLIFGIQFFAKGKTNTGLCMFAMCLASLLALIVYIRHAKSLSPISAKASNCCQKDGEAMSYIVSYLLPFIALPSGKPEDIMSLFIFLFVLAVLYINSEMIHINPVLNIMGWHIHELSLENGGHNVTLLAKRKIRNGDAVNVVSIGEDLYLDIEDIENGVKNVQGK